ncbi:Hypothetical protein A7982_08463 [Minicystis rosea]|nr:Hypothetical protein A7982_08463 [Minicystis rosea]
MNQDQRKELYRRLLRVVNGAVRTTAARSRSPANLDDLVNDVWVHLLEKRVLDRIDPTRGSAEQLVYVAARNHTISLLRKQKRLAFQIVVPQDDAALELEVPSQGPSPVMLLLAHRDLRRGLERFQEDEREMLLLSLLYDLTAAEILAVREEPADSASVGAMQKRLQRLKDRLGEIVAEVVSTPGAPARREGKDAK